MNYKFKNPYLWISIIMAIFSAAGIDFNTLTNWSILVDSVISIIMNPVSLIAVITVIIGIWNDNSTKGLDKIKNKKDNI